MWLLWSFVLYCSWIVFCVSLVCIVIIGFSSCWMLSVWSILWRCFWWIWVFRSYNWGWLILFNKLWIILFLCCGVIEFFGGLFYMFVLILMLWLFWWSYFLGRSWIRCFRNLKLKGLSVLVCVVMVRLGIRVWSILLLCFVEIFFLKKLCWRIVKLIFWVCRCWCLCF